MVPKKNMRSEVLELYHNLHLVGSYGTEQYLNEAETVRCLAWNVYRFQDTFVYIKSCGFIQKYMKHKSRTLKIKKYKIVTSKEDDCTY